MVHLISYDISNTKKRTQLARYLETRGRRIQKSVFFVELSKHEVLTFKNQVQKIAGVLDSQVLLIPLCNGCEHKVNFFGIEKQLLVF